MKSYANDILQRMKESGYSDLSFDFTLSLTNESERGSVLIGASKVDTYIEKLVLSILPESSKKFKNTLLLYPGPLSSFSGKIELLYAFRIIDENIYKALNSLRKIRNKAAHSSKLFSLKDFKDELERVYNFEYGFPTIVYKIAYNNLIAWKLDLIKNGFEEVNLIEYDYKKLWNEQYPDPRENESIKEQLIIWELAYGLTFVCMKIEIIIYEYSLLKSSNKTWINFLDQLSQNK